MAVKRKARKGLATNILCILKHEGVADARFFARRFGFSESAVDRTLNALERQGLAEMSTVMHPGKYFLTQRGHSKVYRSKACPRGKSYDEARAYSTTRYVPIGRARRR